MGDLTKELDRAHEVRKKIRVFIDQLRHGPHTDVDTVRMACVNRGVFRIKFARCGEHE